MYYMAGNEEAFEAGRLLSPRLHFHAVVIEYQTWGRHIYSKSQFRGARSLDQEEVGEVGQNLHLPRLLKMHLWSLSKAPGWLGAVSSERNPALLPELVNGRGATFSAFTLLVSGTSEEARNLLHRGQKEGKSLHTLHTARITNTVHLHGCGFRSTFEMY